jgi:hypothetical protein
MSFTAASLFFDSTANSMPASRWSEMISNSTSRLRRQWHSPAEFRPGSSGPRQSSSRCPKTCPSIFFNRSVSRARSCFIIEADLLSQKLTESPLAKRRQRNERDRDQAFEFLKSKHAIIVILSKPKCVLVERQSHVSRTTAGLNSDATRSGHWPFMAFRRKHLARTSGAPPAFPAVRRGSGSFQDEASSPGSSSNRSVH